jgi:hypothetical protein
MTQAKRRSVPERGWLPIHPTHYERLGVAEGTDSTEIGDTISRALAKATPLALAQSPDAQVPQTDRDLQLACEVLSDPLRREVYDRYLARERGQAAGGPRRRSRVVWLVIVGAIALLWLLVLLFKPAPALPAKPVDAGASASAGSNAVADPAASTAVTSQPGASAKGSSGNKSPARASKRAASR